MITLTDLIIYPVKSAAGIRLSTAEVTARGLAYDRHFMVVDEAGRFVTQREAPRLALVKPRLEAGVIILEAPGQPSLPLTLGGPGYFSLQVQIWDDACEARAASEAANGWFTRSLGQPCSLVFLPPSAERPVDLAYGQPGDVVGFADGFPLLLANSASLADLNARLPAPIPMDRFRPNLVISGASAYAEDRWTHLRVGELDFRVVKPCARCAITTVDQQTAAVGREPLRTLATYRRIGSKVMFGQNLIHDGVGTLRVGDTVAVWEKRIRA